MTAMKTLFALCAAAMVSACASAPYEATSRNTPATLPPDQLASAVSEPQTVARQTASFDVQSVRVHVPRSLTVSESNRFYPGGDIVWREDPMGDRHAQVQKIVQDAMLQGVKNVNSGTIPAMLDIEVARFHALTEKARYTVGGVHAIQFVMVMRDPQTGAALTEPKFVKANFKGLGGQAAVRAEQAGLTQKVRITNHLAGVIQHELTSETGYVAENLGLLGVFN